MSKHTSHTGSAHIVVIICLVLALITALGWIFYQNFIHKETPQKDHEVTIVTRQSAPSNKQNATANYTYVDYRKDGKDGTGVKIASAQDVDTLTNASQKLKAYLKQLVSEYGFTVDRVYGDYAAAYAPGHYAIWGPKNGDGEMTEVAGTQQLGMKCSDLTAAKVPSALVDSKCYAFDSSGSDAQAYTINPYPSR